MCELVTRVICVVALLVCLVLAVGAGRPTDAAVFTSAMAVIICLPRSPK